MIKHFKTKVKGGALYFAIVVILLLSLVASGFILLNRLWFQEDVLFLKNTELNDNLDSAEEWFMVQPDLATPGESNERDLFGDSSTVKIESERWGMLRLIKTSASWKHLNFKRTGLYSELEDKPVALYLADNNRFLPLVGKCKITGECRLPALGIRAGEMDGGTFTGKRMIDGEIYQSGNRLPLLSPKLTKTWEGYLDKKYRVSDSIVTGNDLKRNPVCTASFDEDTKVIDCGKRVFLQNVKLSGNIIVIASDTIQIEASAYLRDILVIAGTIILSDEVEGSFQLFARNEIAIKENCRLRYPSFAICISKQKPGKINIGKNSTVNGGLIIDSASEVKGTNRLEMSEGNKLIGTVYVNGEVGFNGEINGSLYCNKFYIDSPRAYYENFLKDAVINSQSTPARFGSFALDGLPDKLKFVKLCL